jgi:ribonuclease HII
MRVRPTFNEESHLIRQGYRLIAGIDEVGRGPLAGPLIAAAVILPPDIDAPWLSLVRDSKQLSPSMRARLFPLIGEAAVAIGIGSCPHKIIDAIGITWATKFAMSAAIAHLYLHPDFLLVDYVKLTDIDIPQKSIVKGDSRCISIACASIIAKVVRDRLMVDMDKVHPGYGFASHKGYATKEHLECLRRLGACPIHRKCFSPVRACLDRR